MAMEITQILLNAQSPDGNVRNVAEENLRQFQEQNLPVFFLSLSVELANDDKPPESRKLAGLVLKNSLDAKEAARKEELIQRWVSLDPVVKAQIKNALLQTLSSAAQDARHTSSQVIAKIASIEIPRQEWPELVVVLLGNMSSPVGEKQATLKQATLETLGYVCEEISSDVLAQDQVNSILTAVVQGMNTTDGNNDEEDQDQEEGSWNLAMAGGTCLGLVARTVGDDVVPLVMPYVQENISKPDWRCREAATYAFGSILEGPSLEKLSPLVNMALSFILNAMKDENNQVKDSTAWTLSRIFEFLHGPTVQTPIITPANLQPIIVVLLESIKDTPNVAEKVCGALYFLAQGYEQAGSSSPLSPFLADIIGALLATAERKDASDSRLRTSAYETLNEIVRCSTAETANIIVQLLPVILGKLAQTLELQIVSSDDREKQSDLQALLCGVLQVIIQKLGGVDATKYAIQQYADQMMALFLRVFACRSATVHEEAMLAIGALAYATGGEFAKYMPEFYKYVEMGLQNFEEYQVCAISVGVVGDICRALDEKVLPYCDGIMTQLLKDLSSAQLHRSVKPPIFSCFGDIALAIDGNFEKYLNYAMPMLQGAAELSAHTVGQDDEMVDYNNQLRNGIFEAYSGIFQGFKNTKPELMMPYAAHVLQFIEAVFRDKERDDSVTKAAVGVLGDLADTLGSNAALLFRNSAFFKEFLNECMMSEDNQVKETASWAQMTIERIISA
ncbi:hypothetical protein SUGI_0753140 [Cryptomeria japonica]|nr:hypothetical protein SUGI_0753140 [Cryptomeria japonica]